jgi:ParB-like chromosome segregation protein Spo0J
MQIAGKSIDHGAFGESSAVSPNVPHDDVTEPPPTAATQAPGSCFLSNQHVVMVPVSELAPHPRNARTHSRKQVRQVAESIKRFGFNNPVLVDDHGQIIAGHCRVAAAKLVGLAEVPTLRLSHMSEAEVRAYLVADNRLAEQAGWDREVLAAELEVLIDLDFHVGVIGFDPVTSRSFSTTPTKRSATPPGPKTRFLS